MPKFTLIKHRDHETDSEISVTFTTDELGLAKDHFDDFLKASGFELPLDDRMNGYYIPTPSEWEWDDNGEFKFNAAEFCNDGILGGSGADILEFPKRFNNKNHD